MKRTDFVVIQDTRLLSVSCKRLLAGCHILTKPLWNMAGTTGLEPATSAVTGQHSNQLNYVPSIETSCMRSHQVTGSTHALAEYSRTSGFLPGLGAGLLSAAYALGEIISYDNQQSKTPQFCSAAIRHYEHPNARRLILPFVGARLILAARMIGKRAIAFTLAVDKNGSGQGIAK